MGEVFLAHDDRLDRRVAIKRLLPEAGTAPDRRERFRREARLAARINHSSIVQVHDILQESESDYLVMEFVEGETLREMLRKGPLEVRQVLALARELAGGLEAAHRAGIVHRDLKTENVLVPPSGGLKIADFGIAKRFLDEDGGGGDTSLTSADAVVGTCRAMSPEQARGEPVDHQTDLFAFGVLLYETLTGRSPFEAESRLTTLSRVVLHRQAPVHQLNPAVPRQLSELIDRLLEKDPLLRPVSATEVRRELGEIATRLDSSGGYSASDEVTSAIGIPTVPDLPVLAPAFAPAPPVPPRPAPPRLFHLLFGIALSLLAALSLASFVLRSGTRDLSALTAPAGGPTPARAESTFAVLRFQDRSATGESSWMSTAFPEMITDLLRIDGRISAAARQDVPLAELDLRLAGLDGLGPFRQRLDVDYLIAGSYETREDEKLIVRFLIVDRSGRRYLSEIMPGAVPGLVQLSSEIAGAVRRELRLPLLGADDRRIVDAIYADLPPEAWPVYFTGVGHQYRANYERAAELLAEAVRLAPRSPRPGRALALVSRSAGRHADAARAACQARERAQSLPEQDRMEIAALCDDFSGRSAEARSLYEGLLRKNPAEQASYRLSLAAVHMRDREVDGVDRLDDALNVLLDLRGAAPETLRKIDLLNADLKEAEILFQRDRLTEARRLAQGAAARAATLHAFAEAGIARRIEGASLFYLQDYRGAIVPLQEACPRLAAARLELQAATCRESLVVAQFFADRTPLYDLLAESRETYQAAGSLTGVGRVLQIEAILRQASGEHAAGERLSREAEALFAQAGAHRDLAFWRLGMGRQLLIQGELREARKVLDQAYADLSRYEEPASRAVILRNLGELHALRGDLRSARQAFEAAPSGFSSYWLALIDAAEGRSARAIELLKPLLAQEEQRNPALAAQICMALANLLQTDGASGEALEFARKAEKDLAGTEQQDLALLSQVLLVKIHLAQKDFATADERFETVRPQVEKSTDYRVVLEAGITAARLKGLLGNYRLREEALEDLAKIERGCKQQGNVIYSFEARLAAGELMRPPQREERLEEVIREARQLGLEQIARRAERIRGEG